MKAVALNAGATDLAREGNQLGDGRLAAVEARVEAGHLRHTRKPFGHRVNRREVVRLMEGSERHQRSQLLQNLRRHDRWTGKLRPAMHDTVADPEHARPAVPRA